MQAPDALNDRQQGLLAQVAAGGVTEELPDTEETLLRLAQLGHLDADYANGDWSFSIPPGEELELEPEPEPEGQ